MHPIDRTNNLPQPSWNTSKKCRHPTTYWQKENDDMLVEICECGERLQGYSVPREFLINEKPNRGAAQLVNDDVEKTLETMSESLKNAAIIPDIIKNLNYIDKEPKKTLILKCVDNEGIENHFDVGVAYASLDTFAKEGMFRVIDRFGKVIECDATRFIVDLQTEDDSK